MTAARYLGCGWSFPVSRAPADTVTAEGAEKVQQAIRLVLETEPGERIMRPTFGCGLRRYLMQPNTVATRTLMQNDIQRALSTWEPRIQLQAVAVSAGEDPALVFIQIAYVHVRDGRPGSLVYPFYLE
jgi:uncharacterized protein